MKCGGGPMCPESMLMLKCREPSGAMSGMLCDLPGAYLLATGGVSCVKFSFAALEQNNTSSNFDSSALSKFLLRQTRAAFASGWLPPWHCFWRNLLTQCNSPCMPVTMATSSTSGIS